MKSFQHLGQVAYEALRREIQKIDGTIAPSWADLTPTEQAAWLVSMQAVVAELETVH